MSEDRKELFQKIDEFYNLVHKKLWDNFDLNDDSPEYLKYDGSLTLRINNSEFYAEFGNHPGILICEDINKRSDVIYVELELVDGEWMMNSHSKMNPNKYQYTPFTETILDRVIKQFTFVSGYKK